MVMNCFPLISGTFKIKRVKCFLLDSVESNSFLYAVFA